VALHAGTAWPAKWEIVPSVSIEETYSDNITLAPSGSERSDWVTTLNPRLQIRGSGDRARFDIDYSPQLLYWANEEHTRAIQLYTATGTVEFIRRILFLDVRSSETQQIVSLFGPRSDSNINLTQNRTAVRTNSVSPYVRYEFGTSAQGEVRVTYGTVESDAGTADLSNSQSTNIDAKLVSGPAYKVLTWNAAYSKSHVDYKDPRFADVDIQKITAGATRLITPQLALLATVGYDDVDYITTGGPIPRGFLWSAGAEWNPSPRTRLVASAGRRWFGTTGFLEFDHRTRLTVWKLGYVQDISTTTSDFLVPATVDTAGYLNTLFTPTIPDPVARLAAVNSFIARNGLASSFDQPVNFFSSIPFLAKRLRGSFGIQGVRNTILLNLFSEKREALAPNQPGAGDFAESDNTRQTGGDVAWTHILSPLVSANLSLGLSKNEFSGTGRSDSLKSLRASVTRQFLPRVSGSLNYRRIQNSSSESAASYVENVVSINLTARF
jgi:uncharacterized protein (PEP-CTERM system associated)